MFGRFIVCMSPLCVYTIFDERTDKPRHTSILDNGKYIHIELFKGKGSGKPIGDIFSKIKKISKLIEKSEQIKPVVISDYKKHIEQFGLNIPSRRVNVYDVHLPNIKYDDDEDNNKKAAEKILSKMNQSNLLEYRNILANASIVYNYIEKRGIEIGYVPYFPKWSLNTYSGRSKSTSTNIQGWSGHDLIRPPGFGENDMLIHFDWICADIRIASILSGDNTLHQSFTDSDPYQKMLEIVGDEEMTRDQCKLYLLRSINSMDLDSVVFRDIYPNMGRWIKSCKDKVESGRSVRSILGRRYSLVEAKNSFAVLNGVMQGSVAHAMQSVLRRVWEQLPKRIVAEIHDSLIMASGSSSSEMKSVINIVSDIMFQPFYGVLDANPKFPVKVSVGRKWRNWRTIMIKRESGTEYFK